VVLGCAHRQRVIGRFILRDSDAALQVAQVAQVRRDAERIHRLVLAIFASQRVLCKQGGPEPCVLHSLISISFVLQKKILIYFLDNGSFGAVLPILRGVYCNHALR
jgi:hypothetical protein